VADATESMSTYQYANDNPVMGNDPMGDWWKAVDAPTPPKHHMHDFGDEGDITGDPNIDASIAALTAFGAMSGGTNYSQMTDAELKNAAETGDAAAVQAYGLRYGKLTYSAAGNSMVNADDFNPNATDIDRATDNVLDALAYPNMLPEVKVNGGKVAFPDHWGDSNYFLNDASQGVGRPDMMFEGTPVYFSTIGDLKYGGAITLPGIGIFINPKDRNNIDVLRHEFGHILVARNESKTLFYLTDGPYSLLNGWLTKDDLEHQQSWPERDANNASYIYFGRPSNWNFNDYPVSDDVRYPANTDHQYDNIEGGFASGFH
jgi:hypothetical protein